MRRPDSKRGARDRLGTTVSIAIVVVLSSVALGLLARGRQVMRSSPSITESTAPIKQLGELLFHSDSVDSSAEIGALGGGLFLNSNLFVYADALARTLNFVHVDRREIVTVGGHGRGPGEFQIVGGIFRDGQGNVVVDDWAALRATVLDPDHGLRHVAADRRTGRAQGHRADYEWGPDCTRFRPVGRSAARWLVSTEYLARQP